VFTYDLDLSRGIDFAIYFGNIYGAAKSGPGREARDGAPEHRAHLPGSVRAGEFDIGVNRAPKANSLAIQG
jgi:hypothetical protein